MGSVVVLFVFGRIDARLSVLRSVLSECDFFLIVVCGRLVSGLCSDIFYNIIHLFRVRLLFSTVRVRCLEHTSIRSLDSSLQLITPCLHYVC
jgi:hypothetical protein